MVKTIEGKPGGRGKTVAVVVSRFNDFITKRLLDGCINQLLESKVSPKNIYVCWVPGAFEIPVTAQELAKKKNIQAVICLGAVIRGETYHFELVAEGCAEGISAVALNTRKPIILGVLTTDTVDQAYKRSQENGDNKGRDAALTALEMIDLLKKTKKK